MKHTQGKWRIEGDTIASDFGRIANIHFEGEIDKEAEANAKLIASAPEMLEALIKLRKWAISHGIDIDGKIIIDTDLIIKQATE